jgi:hypothetical protein
MRPLRTPCPLFRTKECRHRGGQNDLALRTLRPNRQLSTKPGQAQKSFSVCGAVFGGVVGAVCGVVCGTMSPADTPDGAESAAAITTKQPRRRIICLPTGNSRHQDEEPFLEFVAIRKKAPPRCSGARSTRRNRKERPQACTARMAEFGQYRVVGDGVKTWAI